DWTTAFGGDVELQSLQPHVAQAAGAEEQPEPTGIGGETGDLDEGRRARRPSAEHQAGAADPRPRKERGVKRLERNRNAIALLEGVFDPGAAQGRVPAQVG